MAILMTCILTEQIFIGREMCWLGKRIPGLNRTSLSATSTSLGRHWWFTLGIIRKGVSPVVQILLEKHEPITKIASASEAVTDEKGAWAVPCF